jgi:hypothetical protein
MPQRVTSWFTFQYLLVSLITVLVLVLEELKYRLQSTVDAFRWSPNVS